MNINKQDIAVADYLKANHIKTTVALAQINATMGDDWKCDKWIISLQNQKSGNESFEYHTGTGHRIPKRGSMGFDSKQTVEVKKLKALLDLDRMPHLMQLTGEKVDIRGDRRIDSMRETVTMPPTQASLLYSLLLDSSAGEMTFRDWCDDFGYDTDSRKSLTTYEACQINSDKLCKLFSTAQIDKLNTILEDY